MKKYLILFSGLSFLLSACGSSQDALPQPKSQVTTMVIQQAPAQNQTQQQPTAQGTETPVQALGNPELAAPIGSSCGPSNTGASTLVVAENTENFTCSQVQSVFAEFNKVFGSSTDNFTVQGFTCHTRTEAQRAHDGRSVTCAKPGTRLEAMLYYPLGGIPVAQPETYMVGKLGGGKDETTVGFQVHDDLHCSITAEQGLSCIRSSVTGTGIDTLGMRPGESGQWQTLHGVLDTMLNGKQKYLAPGETISAYGMSCIHSGGGNFTCTDGKHTITAGLTSFASN